MLFPSPAHRDLLCTNFFFYQTLPAKSYCPQKANKQFDLAPIICKYNQVIFYELDVFIFFKKLKKYIITQKGKQ